MNQWTEVRRQVLTGELSKCAACREYDLSWQTLEKMPTYVEPPGYRMRERRKKRRLDPFLSIIHEMLEADKQAPQKQGMRAHEFSTDSKRSMTSTEVTPPSAMRVA